MKPNNHSEDSPRAGIRVHPLYIILLVAVNLVVIMVLGWPRVQERLPSFRTETPSPTVTVTPSPTLTRTLTPSPTATATASPSPTRESAATLSPSTYNFTSQAGILILSLREGGNAHLFAYAPFAESNGETYTALPLTRLTDGAQNDITPALSPDGKYIAFASTRNGVWDIYTLSLESGEISQVTNTPGYEASPTWSPDGQWLAFEAYEGGNLEIMYQDVALENAPKILTNHPAGDYEPAWSHDGRMISFISTREGQSAVWLADLDQREMEERFSQISNLSAQRAKHPTWSPDGRYLAWAEIGGDGAHQIITWDTTTPNMAPTPAGSGDWPIWDQEGRLLFTTVETPLETYLTAYPLPQSDTPQVMLPAVRLPGKVEGLAWVPALPKEMLANNAPELTPTPLWETKLSQEQSAGGRYQLAPLENVSAPYPQLHDLADESFLAMRKHLSQKSGWDFLATLENAFLPLTAPPDPNQELSWTFTGRGIEVSDLPRQAGWMVVVREDYGMQTYWRVYVRANSQAGDQGRPLHELPWNFEARYGNASLAFERGGAVADTIPNGYWVDFTALATAYGWERVPALSSWQSAFPSARFQGFALREGLSWMEAMLEIYPPEALE
ncbi:MAG: hypothetical protein MAG431_02425 [Chloroflexi bacterium]|nr:hypothetical protein [Chloroflexota bacterium]